MKITREQLLQALDYDKRYIRIDGVSPQIVYLVDILPDTIDIPIPVSVAREILEKAIIHPVTHTIHEHETMQELQKSGHVEQSEPNEWSAGEQPTVEQNKEQCIGEYQTRHQYDNINFVEQSEPYDNEPAMGINSFIPVKDETCDTCGNKSKVVSGELLCDDCSHSYKDYYTPQSKLEQARKYRDEILKYANNPQIEHTVSGTYAIEICDLYEQHITDIQSKVEKCVELLEMVNAGTYIDWRKKEYKELLSLLKEIAGGE